MADYGVDSAIPNAAPSQAPQPVEQAQVPAAPQGHSFNEEALGQAFDKIASPSDVSSLQSSANNPKGDQRQWGDVNAIGQPSQIAQASIGRNINERLQIWSKLVGDPNAMIGPAINGQNDIWIRGQDKKFHPADSGHTDFMQDVAKKTGAGIDLVAQSVSSLAGAGAGTMVGAPEVGAAVGYAAGPGLSSAGKEFLMTRAYGVKPDPEQLKRDMYIGGAMNLFVGGIMGGMGRISSNAAQAIEEGPQARMTELGKAQVAAKNFMDSVGARPNEIINDSGDVAAPMSNAGEKLWSATQLKRKELNDLIGTANDKIIASSPTKVNTQGLAMGVKDFLQKDGFQFDENGMPKPYDAIPVGANPVSGEPLAIVSASRVNRSSMGTEALNNVAEDYKALASGQMGMDDFLQLIRDWQENAKFKVLDERSDSTRSGWAQLQHMATNVRQQEIQSRFSNDPDMLQSIKSAYHEYSSSKDAIDMIYNAYAKNQNSPELLAKLFVQPGKKELLSQAKSLFADKPEIMKDVRSAWLSEKLGTYMSEDGSLNAPGFVKDLKQTGGETLNQLFSPGELADIQRSASIMGRIKTSDLVSKPQGDAVVDALGKLTDASQSVSFSKPWALMKWLENKPKFADYACGPDGLTKLASQSPPRTASVLNGISSMLKNKLSQQAASVAIKQTQFYNKVNPFGVSKPISPPPQGYQGSDAAADQMLK